MERGRHLPGLRKCPTARFAYYLDKKLDQKSNYNISESDLIKGSIAGDRRMQEELYRRFAPKMYAVVCVMPTIRMMLRDLLQEGGISRYIKICTASGQRVHLKDVVRRVFVNTSIEHFRKKSAQLSSVSEKEENTIEDTDIPRLTAWPKRISSILCRSFRPVTGLYSTCMWWKGIRTKRSVSCWGLVKEPVSHNWPGPSRFYKRK